MSKEYKKKYWKFIFTRWYFWLVILFCLISNIKISLEYIISNNILALIGGLIFTFFISLIIPSIIYLFYKIKKDDSK